MSRTQPYLRLFGALFLASSLAGCANLQELRSAQLPEKGFHARLASDYRAYAEKRAAKGDWLDADYFASKGLAAARREKVQPEFLKNWSIPEALRPELEKARAETEAMLADEAVRLYPGRTAHLLFLFDCWVEQSESSWHEGEQVACKDEFMPMLANLRQKLGAAQPANPQEAERLMQRRTVYFDYDLSTLREDAKRTIAETVGALKQLGAFVVRLTGHTDRSGTQAEYNKALSEVRANAVKAEMMIQGVPKERITALGVGDSQPMVQTHDGEREERNRRVEIDVLRDPASLPPAPPLAPAPAAAVSPPLLAPTGDRP